MCSVIDHILNIRYFRGIPNCDINTVFGLKDAKNIVKNDMVSMFLIKGHISVFFNRLIEI